MAPSPLSRRAFLAATGSLALAAACGGSGRSKTTGSRSTGGEGQPHQLPGGKGLSALLLSSDLYASPQPQRLAFALADGPRFASGPPARLAYGPQNGSMGQPVDAVLHDRGLPAGRGIYTVDATLPAGGVWLGTVETGGKQVPLAFQVQDQTAVPVPGQPAPRAASPTFADPLGVDPVCTRNPQCPLHQVSLEAVIGAGKPVAVMFATPARCESRYCGPVLDDLLTLVDTYQDRLTFVHVEIYKRLTGTTLVPTLKPWGITTEPWLFAVDANGTVVARLDGAFGHDEQQQLLDRLVA